MSYKVLTKESYEKTAEEFAQNVADLAPLTSIEKMLSLLPPHASLIDLGCGSGRDAKLFSERGINVTGIDFCENLIHIAKATAPLAHFHVMDLEAMPFSAGTFDGAWAATSLLHLSKQILPKVLTKIHSLLKEQGHFYLSLKKGIGEGVLTDTRYGKIEKFWSFFEEKELTQFLEAAKFKILELTLIEKKHSYQTHASFRVFCQKG